MTDDLYLRILDIVTDPWPRRPESVRALIYCEKVLSTETFRTTDEISRRVMLSKRRDELVKECER
jgi:hypothetical protein